MQHSWRVDGAFADWKLTLTIDPPNDPDSAPLPEWPARRAESIAQYFREIVNCHENHLDAENCRRDRRR